MNPLLLQPVPTGDASARYERLSHGGTTWYDLMPTPANGTDSGTPGFWPNFDDASWVSLGRPAKLDFADAFTVVAWAKQTREDPPRDNQERIISRDSIAARAWTLSKDDDTGVISFFVWERGGGGGDYENVQTGGATDGTWHFLVGVNEGAGNDLKLYVDGVLAVTGVGEGLDPSDAAADIEFGRRQDGGGPDFFQGVIDTGRFYSRALSADEILRDYHAGKPAHP